MKKMMLEQAAEKYGTPLYVFDTDILRENVKWFREMLQEEAALCYAMKANPFLTAVMAKKTDRIEVCSMGEYHICKDLHIPPEKLLISGVLKKKEDLYEILDCEGGSALYSIESIGQFRSINDWCEKRKKKIRVFLRLSSGNQFGMDQDRIAYIAEGSNRSVWMEIQGIHYFSGTQKKNRMIFQQELHKLDLFCLELEERFQLKIKELEYGPGLGITYFEGQENETEEDLKALARAIDDMEFEGQVVLEMGRALAARCGYYFTAVRDVKQTGDKNYCIVDGGMHQLNYDGQIRGMYVPHFMKLLETEAETSGEPEDAKEYTICGALCTANDILVQKARLMEPAEGDVLVFENTGAYAMTEGMALFLSHALPKVAVYSKRHGWKLVRDRISTYTMNMEKETKKNGYIMECFK